MQHAVGVRIQDRVLAYGLEGWQAYDSMGAITRGGAPLQAHHVRRAYRAWRAGCRCLGLIGVGMLRHPTGGIHVSGIQLLPGRRKLLAHEHGPADVSQAVDRLAGREAMRDFYHLSFAIAVDEEVGLGVD